MIRVIRFGFAILSGLLMTGVLQAQQWRITELETMPEPVSNQAVCGAVVQDTPYVFSFAGIDSTRISSGIHLRSYAYNTVSGTWMALPSLPDTLGKVAAAANAVGGIVYIFGGYHVFPDGSEKSSSSVHRFDPITRTYLSDGAPIPVPIDDHVQAVWRDSLVFLVGGWSENTNVPDVQIYDPANDTWLTGTSLPDDNTYKHFGSTGTIVKDTLWYFGGASLGFSFPIQSTVRWGVIDPTDPTQIEWHDTVWDVSVTGYRMACTSVYDDVHWLGGSATTYNYNGIAYNGSGPVAPEGRDLWLSRFDRTAWNRETNLPFPMDLRGLASIDDTLKYICGGMEAGPVVSDRLWRLERINHPSTVGETLGSQPGFRLYPNPAQLEVVFEFPDLQGKEQTISVYDATGRSCLHVRVTAPQVRVDVSTWPSGIYWVRLPNGDARALIVRQ